MKNINGCMANAMICCPIPDLVKDKGFSSQKKQKSPHSSKKAGINM